MEENNVVHKVLGLPYFQKKRLNTSSHHPLMFLRIRQHKGGGDEYYWSIAAPPLSWGEGFLFWMTNSQPLLGLGILQFNQDQKVALFKSKRATKKCSKRPNYVNIDLLCWETHNTEERN